MIDWRRCHRCFGVGMFGGRGCRFGNVVGVVAKVSHSLLECTGGGLCLILVITWCSLLALVLVGPKVD